MALSNSKTLQCVLRFTFGYRLIHGVLWSKSASTEPPSTGLKQLTEDGEAGIGHQRALSPGLMMMMMMMILRIIMLTVVGLALYCSILISLLRLVWRRLALSGCLICASYREVSLTERYLYLYLYSFRTCSSSGTVKVSPRSAALHGTCYVRKSSVSVTTTPYSASE